MNDLLVQALREDEVLAVNNEWRVRVCNIAANRIEELERNLAEERHSREVAADKAWKFSDRIIELELELKETEGTIWSLHKTIEDISNRGNR